MVTRWTLPFTSLWFSVSCINNPDNIIRWSRCWVLKHFLQPCVFSHFHTALDDVRVCCVPQSQVHSDENHSWRTAQKTLPGTSQHVDIGPNKAFRKGRTSFSRLPDNLESSNCLIVAPDGSCSPRIWHLFSVLTLVCAFLRYVGRPLAAAVLLAYNILFLGL